MNEEDILVVGKISGVYGVKGWVRVFSHTEPRKGILEYDPWLIRRGGRWIKQTLTSGRVHGKGIVVQLKECADRDQAHALIGSEIAISRSQLAATVVGEYYWTDLVGLIVRTVDGDELGSISHLFETGANDVIVVKGDRERLIPYLSGSVVQDVRLDEGIMIVNWDPEF